MLRVSLKSFYERHKNDADLNLTPTEKTEINIWLNEHNFHLILRKQITMNPIPKRIRTEETPARRNRHEAHSIMFFSEKVSLLRIESFRYSTFLDEI